MTGSTPLASNAICFLHLLSFLSPLFVDVLSLSYNDFLSLASAASLVQLEMALEPARLRSRFNWTRPDAAQFEAIWSHYAATPADASALPLPSANLPSPSDPNPAADGLLTVTAALLDTEAARAPTKLSLRGPVAVGEPCLSKAQTVRLVADTVLSSQETAQVLAVWKEVADRKRERLPEHNLTVFVELRTRMEQMIRAMLQVLRPTNDPRAYVRKTDLQAFMMPKVCPVSLSRHIVSVSLTQSHWLFLISLASHRWLRRRRLPRPSRKSPPTSRWLRARLWYRPTRCCSLLRRPSSASTCTPRFVFWSNALC
jgi:hypothetical protein